MHPGGGQYDCLAIMSSGDCPGHVQLNRNGRIHVLERFDGREADWEPVEWDEYLRADPKGFLHHLEASAGLPAPSTVPAVTPRTLTLRILAAIAATCTKSVEPIEIIPGMIDTSGYGAGPHLESFAAFSAIPRILLAPRGTDYDGQPEYRFWFVWRSEEPILAFEQREGMAWTRHHAVAWPLMDLYAESRRHLLVTALKLLRRVDHV